MLKLAVTGLTGMDPKSPYEEPEHPELTLDTVNNTIDKTVNNVIDFLKIEVSYVCRFLFTYLGIQLISM